MGIVCWRLFFLAPCVAPRVLGGALLHAGLNFLWGAMDPRNMNAARVREVTSSVLASL